MNYNDQILENKAFNFVKQLTYNIALAICVMLVGVLIMVYGFKIGLYEVLSNSQAPHIVKGDMVVVKPQDSYKVGDIIKFDTTANKTFPTTHRLVGIIKNASGQVTQYICHGDAVDDLDGTDANYKWKDDAAYVKTFIDQNKTAEEIEELVDGEIQIVLPNQVEGVVIGHLDNYGYYLKFLKEHTMLVIAIVAGIWCVTNVVQNEIDIRKTRRLL